MTFYAFYLQSDELIQRKMEDDQIKEMVQAMNLPAGAAILPETGDNSSI